MKAGRKAAEADEREYEAVLEIVFSDSAEGVIKYAQGWGEGRYSPSCVGFGFEDNCRPSRLKLWMLRRQYQRKEKKEWESAVVLKGQHQDVFGLSLFLSVGDIAPENFWENRGNVLMEAKTFDLPGDQLENAQKSVQSRLETVQSKIKTICERAKAGEALRIWMGRSPEDLSMLAWFGAELVRSGLSHSKVYINELPEKYNRPEGGAVSYGDWSEVEVSQWGRLDQELRREAPEDFLSQQAEIWAGLQQENGELRIVQNGTLKSVRADYYDDFIRAEIDRQPEEFYEAQVIGELIGTQLRMPDTWIAGRIELLIDSGELAVAWEEEPGVRSYRRRLRKMR